jgi:DNA-binding GntR family transcriptional regulator
LTIRNQTASARAYLALERMIVMLELAPGAVTTERELIDRIGLGRTPVREAIQRLAWEGLLEIRSRAGIAVAPLEPADWLRVIDARTGVEILLARGTARFGAATSSSPLHEVAVAMQRAAAASDVPGFLEADKALDELMAAHGDNPYAARLAAPLQTHSRRFWFRFRSAADLPHSAEHHVRLIDALLKGDEEAAGRQAAQLMEMLRGLALKLRD